MRYSVSSNWAPVEYEVGGIKLAVFRAPIINRQYDIDTAQQLKQALDLLKRSLIIGGTTRAWMEDSAAFVCSIEKKITFI